MKRILIFSLAYYPRVGGAEVAIKEITDRIAPSDMEFHMVTLRFSPHDAAEEKIGNVVVHRVGSGSSHYVSKIFFVPQAALVAKKLHKKYHFNSAWAMMSYMALPVALLSMLGVRLPYVLTLQDGDPFEQVFNRARIAVVRPLLRAGFRHSTVAQVISTYLGEWPKKFGYEGPIEIIPNGVDAKKFTGEKVAHEGIVLITTSRLVHKNAVDDIVRALPLLPADVHLRVLGTGPDEAMLKNLVYELGVAGRVEFAGFVDHVDLPRHLHAADIFIRPSRSEGMGISFVEAFAAGLPVIATQEGGIADFLFDARRNPSREPTGFAVDKDNPKQIAEAVEYILGNSAQVQKVVENAQELAFKGYDWNLIAKEMREKVFDRVLKN